MRKHAIAVVALALAGCGSSKSVVIPSDPARWDQLADATKKLGDDDRKAVGAYLMRMGLSSALAGGKGAMPPGTTIGDAIRDQKDFEVKQQAEQAQAEALKAKVEAQRAAAIAKLGQSATVVVSELRVLPKNYEAGRFSERLDLVLAAQNHTLKSISGIKGALIFKDQFGADIAHINLSLDEDVAPNSSRAITGYGKDINQFEASDTKLAVTPLSKMHVVFEPAMIVFGDGTKIAAPEDVGS